MSVVDWTVLSPEVMAIIERQAHRVVSQYDGVLEWADLRQEGYIAVATHADIVRKYLDNDDLGFLSRWIWQRLTDVARKANNSHKREYSYNELDLDEL